MRRCAVWKARTLDEGHRPEMLSGIAYRAATSQVMQMPAGRLRPTAARLDIHLAVHHAYTAISNISCITGPTLHIEHRHTARRQVGWLRAG